MLSVFKWLLLLPAHFASTLAAWVVAPIAVLFRHEYSLKGTCFWWTTTPNCDLRGDPDHQKRWHHANSYFQFVTWIWRNPAVNFQREYLGVPCQRSDYLEKGKYLSRIYRGDTVVAWMVFVYWRYPFKKDRAFRLLLGWKTWDFLVKDPLQITCLLQPWKSYKE